MKRYISKILTLLGVGVVCTACYGSPHERYMSIEVNIEGSVTDEGGNPIKGIQIHAPQHTNSTSFTNDEGNYVLRFPANYNETYLLLEFDDIDGEDNGGDFTSTAVTVDIEANVAPTVVMTLKQ